MDKKKVIIVTVHIGANFGSALQAYATKKIFQDLDYEVSVLDYHPSRMTWKRYFLGMLDSPGRFCRRLLFLPKQIVNNSMFSSFLNKYCSLTKAYYSLDEIKRDLPKADIFVTGSDQVWNSFYNEGLDEVYYLDYLPNDVKKIAFASSLGAYGVRSEELR